MSDNKWKALVVFVLCMGFFGSYYLMTAFASGDSAVAFSKDVAGVERVSDHSKWFVLGPNALRIPNTMDATYLVRDTMRVKFSYHINDPVLFYGRLHPKSDDFGWYIGNGNDIHTRNINQRLMSDELMGLVAKMPAEMTAGCGTAASNTYNLLPPTMESVIADYFAKNGLVLLKASCLFVH